MRFFKDSCQEKGIITVTLGSVPTVLQNGPTVFASLSMFFFFLNIYSESNHDFISFVIQVLISLMTMTAVVFAVLKAVFKPKERGNVSG